MRQLRIRGKLSSMVALTRYGTDVGSVFDLAGSKENDLTAALGFTLDRCPQLCSAIVNRVAEAANIQPSGDMSLALEVSDSEGRTDLELRLGDSLLIFEAKRGWHLPTREQLAQYTGRIRHGTGRGALVTLSQASPALAAHHLPTEISGVAVVHLPWRAVLEDITTVRPTCRGHQRIWLDELQTYLRGVIRMRSVSDSWTYSVVLNNERPNGSRFTFLEYVTDELTYFHPYGTGGWPTEPPNFLAFRWNGAVRRIHRVEDYDVVPTLLDRYPELPEEELRMRPHAVYKLSARRLPPLEPIPNGATYRAARLWVLLDQLQTADSLAEAIERTRHLTANA